VHFIGLGGIGVSALAQVAQARGARVSGSDSHVDLEANPALARLIAHGAECHTGHRRSNVAEGVTRVVATAAVSGDNPEIVEARDRGIPVISRAACLGELMAAHRGPTIAVGGTHGKSTTTAMLGVLLQGAGLDPTVFVGGEVAQLGGNVRIGSPDGPFVAEACEAYDSFLHLHPDVAIVTNVEADHLDHYGTEAGVFDGFLKFAEGVADGGSIVACADDEGARRLATMLPAGHRARVVTCGIDAPDADVAARGLCLGARPRFELVDRRTGGAAEVQLGVPGRHNVENALAAAAAALLAGASLDRIAAGLGAFRGTVRRQERLGEIEAAGGRALVIDDYAHHPTEIRATLEAIRGAYPYRRLIAVFQPHLYSRTRDFLEEFGRSLSTADMLVVTDVYAAREEPIPGVDSAAIVEAARRARPDLDATYIRDRHAIPSRVAGIARAGDLILFLGAGDIREQAEALVRLGAPAGAVL